MSLIILINQTQSKNIFYITRWKEYARDAKWIDVYWTLPNVVLYWEVKYHKLYDKESLKQPHSLKVRVCFYVCG